MSGRFNLAEYVTVDDRITRYWEMHPKPEGSIQTEIIWVSDDGNSVAIKATVYMGDRILATGIAQEERGPGGANKTSWWENCETSAIGRALANMDMSLSKNRPSRQEMQKVERYEDARQYGVVAYEPAPRRTPPPPSDPRPAAPQAAGPPPNIVMDPLAFDKVIDRALELAEDGKTLDDIRNHLNLNRHGMTRDMRENTAAALTAIEAKYFAPAGAALAHPVPAPLLTATDTEEHTMNLVNLTPHALHVIFPNDATLTIPSDGLARATTERVQIGTIETDGGSTIPLFRTTFGAITGLPDPVEGTVYLVSNIVAQAVRRDDVLIVDDMVRDGEGRILGCRAFARV